MKQRDLVLVEMPYSNHLETKIRPAVIVSNNKYNESHQDIVLCGITSVLEDLPYRVSLEFSDTMKGNLPKPSQIRADKIIFFEKKRIKKTFDQLSTTKFNELIQQIHALVST